MHSKGVGVAADGNTLVSITLPPEPSSYTTSFTFKYLGWLQKGDVSGMMENAWVQTDLQSHFFPAILSISIARANSLSLPIATALIFILEEGRAFCFFGVGFLKVLATPVGNLQS